MKSQAPPRAVIPPEPTGEGGLSGPLPSRSPIPSKHPHSIAGRRYKDITLMRRLDALSLEIADLFSGTEDALFYVAVLRRGAQILADREGLRERNWRCLEPLKPRLNPRAVPHRCHLKIDPKE